MEKFVASSTSFREKSRVFQVIKASGFVAIALAKIGASLVGKILKDLRTEASVGAFVIFGGRSKKFAHARESCGNFNGIFLSISSII